MTRTIRLMADYQCHPLWEVDPPGNLDPAELNLSAGLQQRLTRWAEAYDRSLNPADPAGSGFACPTEEEAFQAEGQALWQALRRELGDGYQVLYQA